VPTPIAVWWCEAQVKRNRLVRIERDTGVDGAAYVRGPNA
jgi:hypothetical protein